MIKIVDTTMRDGEQRAGLAFNVQQKLELAQKIDQLGVFQIEAGIPAMGGLEKESIKKMMRLGLKSKVSAWNRMDTKDIEKSMDCEVDIIHISVPASDIQIKTKLSKTREWLLEKMMKCILFTTEHGFEVTIGLEDASRADFSFLQEIIKSVHSMGVQRVRYADTLGILMREKIFTEIKRLKEDFDIDIEIHAHNDLGMAVINSVWAAMAGANYINTTLWGIGERAGNCNYYELIHVIKNQAVFIR